MGDCIAYCPFGFVSLSGQIYDAWQCTGPTRANSSSRAHLAMLQLWPTSSTAIPTSHGPASHGPATPRASGRHAPLADRLRPGRVDEVAGQDHLLGPDGPLGRMLAEGKLGSIVFWGPPGVGKTTIARLLADATDLAFVQISAIFTGVADLKKIFEAARLRRQNGRGTLLFVDEIHRFNRAQQDAFLPLMEDGTIVLVGATTENPSFELNAALLSRARVLVAEPPRRRRRSSSIAARAEAELGPPPAPDAGGARRR